MAGRQILRPPSGGRSCLRDRPGPVAAPSRAPVRGRRRRRLRTTKTRRPNPDELRPGWATRDPPGGLAAGRRRIPQPRRRDRRGFGMTRAIRTCPVPRLGYPSSRDDDAPSSRSDPDLLLQPSVAARRSRRGEAVQNSLRLPTAPDLRAAPRALQGGGACRITRVATC